MAGERATKQDRPKEKIASAHRPTGKKPATPPDEELSPERRAELAQQAEARRFRGKPPSI